MKSFYFDFFAHFDSGFSQKQTVKVSVFGAALTPGIAAVLQHLNSILRLLETLSVYAFARILKHLLQA